MPVVSGDIWKILYTVSRYLFPLLAVCLVFLVLFYILSDARDRREKVRGLPGSGTVGELIVLSGGRDLDANTWFPVPREACSVPSAPAIWSSPVRAYVPGISIFPGRTGWASCSGPAPAAKCRSTGFPLPAGPGRLMFRLPTAGFCRWVPRRSGCIFSRRWTIRRLPRRPCRRKYPP